jgi:tetratricopeptide (TPR) repeat protein
MRGAWIIAATLITGGTLAAPARAGVYFTTGTFLPKFARPDDANAQERWPLAGNVQQFQLDLADYRAAMVDLPNRVSGAVWSLTAGASPAVAAIPVSLATSLQVQQQLPPPDKTLGMHYVRRVAELEQRQASGLLSLDDRINLGAYYIRLGNYQKAIQVLSAQESRHFMLRANLATAYELAGMPERAASYRELALSSWPTIYPGWDTVHLNFYRKAEQYHLNLLRLRQEQARSQPAKAGRLQLDNLFPRLHFNEATGKYEAAGAISFVGPSGKYEAGSIAPAQYAELPGDAPLIVMQLLLWLPFDDRLHWQLAELLNANGDVDSAAALMQPVVNKPQDPTKWDAGAPPELREHYRVLKAATEVRKAMQNVQLSEDRWVDLKLLAALYPRGMGLGAGDLIQEASWPAIVIWSESPRTEAQPTAPPPASSSWLPDLKNVAVGFAAGAVVALLLGYQIRQMRGAKV